MAAMTKLQVTVIAAAVAVLLAVGVVAIVVLNRDPSYTRRPIRDPQKILFEANTDAEQGRYKEALAKDIWHRDNALRLEPNQSGLRDSMARWCFGRSLR